MQVNLIAITQPIALHNCEELIEYAGRKCTATTDRVGQNTAQFIKQRVKQGHTSILEHVNFTFEIDDISRACLAQLTRHRIGFSYSVESQRYVNQYNQDFIFPESIRNDEEAMGLYDSFVNDAFVNYQRLIDNGITKEDARMILPMATYTNLVLTANLRALRHLFDLRLDKAAQSEIRELATKMKAIVMEYCANAF